MSQWIYKPSSAITFATVETERSRVMEYCQDKQHQEIVIDLSDVIQCDSAGLALLIDCKRVSKKHNKTCTIIGMTPMIRAWAEFCGVQEILLNP